jgi:hypothetical protein
MTQKTNLEHKHHKKAKKHHKKHHQHAVHSLVETGEFDAEKPAPVKKTPAANATKAAAKPKPAVKKPAPVAAAFLNTKAMSQDQFDKQAQNVDVPIDEVKAITLKVSPTYNLDTVESVTLKSFRKVVGYDTFNSILKGNRDEKKDISDHYNVTVSMMIKRVPPEVAAAPARDPYNGGKSLAESLDKGFPYDDGDSSPDNMTPNWRLKKQVSATNVGKLNGENVTKEALVNLIRDTDSPVTQSLVQLDEMKSDADGLFKLMDANVTRGNLKNLITDKPAPITVALA